MSIDCWIIAINFLDYQMRLVWIDVYRISRGQWIVIWLIYWFGKCVRRTEYIPTDWSGASRMAMRLCFHFGWKRTFKTDFLVVLVLVESELRSAKRSIIFFFEFSSLIPIQADFALDIIAHRIYLLCCELPLAHTHAHTHTSGISHSILSLLLNLVFMRAN